jgi:hypothetical protein
VGVTGVLTKDECHATIHDTYLPEGFDIDDVKTYDKLDIVTNRYGVIGNDSLFTHRLLTNRSHPNVYKAFQTLYDQKDLIVNHDRVAIMRPTDISMAWDTPYTFPGLHLDVDPQGFTAKGYDVEIKKYLKGINYKDKGSFTAENNGKHYTMGTRIQSVLNLLDNEEEDGGFQCVPMPDSNEWLREWVPKQKWTTEMEPNGRYFFDGKSFGKLGLCKTRVPCPAGTLIMFNATLPHGTMPNRSSKPRAIQFIRYSPVTDLEDYKARSKLITKLCKDCKFPIDTNFKKGALLGKW